MKLSECLDWKLKNKEIVSIGGDNLSKVHISGVILNYDETIRFKTIHYYPLTTNYKLINPIFTPAKRSIAAMQVMAEESPGNIEHPAS